MTIKQIVQILNNHSLPTVAGNDGFIRDSEGQFNKVAQDIAKLYLQSYETAYCKGWADATTNAIQEINKHYES